MTPGAPVDRHRSYDAWTGGDVLEENLLETVVGPEGVARSGAHREVVRLSLA